MGATGAHDGQRGATSLLGVLALLVGLVVAVGPAEASGPAEAPSTAETALVPPEGARPIIRRGGTWLVRDSLTTGPATTTFAFGAAGDTPVAGDWDGNGTDTPGVVRGGTWLLRNSNSSGPAQVNFDFGRPTDIPVVGDWDGNGTYTPGVVRGGTWFLRNSNTTGPADVSFPYGRRADIPVAGDWDGNGTFTPGVVRNGTWFLRNAAAGGTADVTFPYGRLTDRPVVGDWDADGTTTAGVLRDNTWNLRNSHGGGAADVVFAYGRSCDVALTSESARTRQWGGAPVRPSLVGTEMSVLPTSDRVVALTFDAGANANGVPSILSTLRSQCVPATFFLTGEWTRDFPQQAGEIGQLFPVGNHTDTHPSLPQLTDAQVRSEVLTAQGAIHTSTRYDQRPMFRFPFGERDARTLGIVNSLGYGSVRWTVDTIGWRGTSGGQSVDTILTRVLNTLQPGQIVLMHVGSHPTDGSTLDADALPRIISELRARGYSFVTIPPYV